MKDTWHFGATSYHWEENEETLAGNVPCRSREGVDSGGGDPTLRQDLINSLISAVFLGGVAVVTIKEKGRKQLLYIGGILCLSAAILCVIDAMLVTRKTRDNKKAALEAKT